MDEPQTQGVAPPEKNGREDDKSKKPSLWRRRPAVLVGTLAIAALLIWGFGIFARTFSHERTDYAFLAADIVSISPKVSGEVTEVFVQDNQIVKAGEPLVQIDPRDLETAMAQKQAALSAADANTNVIEASFKMLGVQVATAQATARQSDAQAAADRVKA